jgi:hypothetical protein
MNSTITTDVEYRELYNHEVPGKHTQIILLQHNIINRKLKNLLMKFTRWPENKIHIPTTTNTSKTTKNKQCAQLFCYTLQLFTAPKE